MKKKSSKNIRAWIIVLIIYSIIVVIFPLMFSKNISSEFEYHIDQQRKVSVSRLANLAYNSIEPIIFQLRNGEISKEEAKRRIISYVREMKYSDEYGPNYIFMCSYDGTVLVQPYDRKMEGSNQWHIQDVNGKYIVQALVNAAKTHPQGSFVSYYYYLPNQTTIEEKLSYVIGISDIDAYIGTGIYLESNYMALEEILNKQNFSYRAITIFVLVSMLLYASLLLKANYKLKVEMQERKKDMEKIHHLAYYDNLTGLPNRMYIMNELNEKMNNCYDYLCIGTIYYIDIDNFKYINDTHGHSVGDKVLIEIAKRLNTLSAPNLILSRLSGDEFLILYYDMLSKEETLSLSEKILALFREEIVIDNISVYITCSIGIARYPFDGDTLESLLKHVDLAAHKAKSSGKDKYTLYNNSMKTELENRADLENRLREAYKNDEFLLHYQPQIDTESGQVVGVEALLRWNSPTHGLIYPGYFISVAEEIGLINDIGKKVIDSSFKFASKIQDKKICVSCNVSPLQLKQNNFVRDVIESFDRYGLVKGSVALEITESCLIEPLDDVLTKLNELKKHGILIYLDDFGTGYSSLNYMKSLPIDALKIDKSFVDNTVTDGVERRIIKTIISLAQEIGLNVIAEGVEEKEQQTYLSLRGCNTMQGYLFSKPIAEKDLLDMI